MPRWAPHREPSPYPHPRPWTPRPRAIPPAPSQIKDEYQAALAQSTAAATVRHEALERELADADAQRRVASEVAAAELASARHAMRAEARQEQQAAVEAVRLECVAELEAKVATAVKAARSEDAAELQRLGKLRGETEEAMGVLRDELGAARKEAATLAAKAKAAELQHESAMQMAASYATSDLKEALSVEQGHSTRPPFTAHGLPSQHMASLLSPCAQPHACPRLAPLTPLLGPPRHVSRPVRP